MSEKETNVSESHKLEIEISVVLLGFIFVMYSIILTMPSDVLNLLTPVGFQNFFSIPYVRGVDLVSGAGLYCSFSLLAAVPFYLLFFKIRREWILLIARSLLAVGLYLSVILLVVINLLFSERLVGAVQTNVSVAPFGSIVLNLSALTIIFYLIATWGFWLYKNIRKRL
jgi:hypothetical protein